FRRSQRPAIAPARVAGAPPSRRLKEKRRTLNIERKQHASSMLGDSDAFSKTDNIKNSSAKSHTIPIVRWPSRRGGPILRLAAAGLADRPGDTVADGYSERRRW